MYIEKETAVLDVQLYGVSAGTEIRVYDTDLEKSIFVTVDLRIDEIYYSVCKKSAMITCLDGEEEDPNYEPPENEDYLEQYEKFCDTQNSKYAKYFQIAQCRVDELMKEYSD